MIRGIIKPVSVKVCPIRVQFEELSREELS